MKSKQFSDIQSQLKMAINELESKQPQAALARLNQLHSQFPDNCDIEHLIALSYKALGELSKAEQYFKQCLKIDQRQPEVYNNLANLLKSQGRFEQAQQHYLQALSLQPNYLQAQRNLAICYQAQANYSSAVDTYKQALKLSANDISSLNGIADCLRLMGDLAAAKLAYKHVLNIDPQNYKAWHNLGLNFHLQKSLDDAVDCYHKAYAIAPQIPELTESLALALYESGQVRSAIELFESALVVHPANVALHESFNTMLWETRFKDQFGDSYITALKSLTKNDPVAISYVSLLYRAGRVQQAKRVMQETELDLSQQHQALSLKGQINAELGEYDLAYEALALSLHKQFSKEVAVQMVKIDILLERYSQAQDSLTGLFNRFPNCQLTWGLQSLVWRLNQDERYSWLCDYQNFIQTFQLEAPQCYSSLESFLSAIREELTLLHMNENAPLQQTLRNGTQTAARLLDSPSKVIQDLRECLSLIVTRYIESLPKTDDEHPFLSRKSSSFEFSGSWSVKLHADGFHINHVHPEGWISSSCYITIPVSMNCTDQVESNLQGYIKFGESPLQLGSREKVELSIQPKLGMVVLFPSYFWHGTYPFAGGEADFRLTAPFDVVPHHG